MSEQYELFVENDEHFTIVQRVNIEKAFRVLSDVIRDITIGHGFRSGKSFERNPGEIIALIHSEVSEALEGVRKDRMDDHLPEYPQVAVEMADTVIRILDFMDEWELSNEFVEALLDKIEYNQRREHMHGKKF